jgi:hypothetical protein
MTRKQGQVKWQPEEAKTDVATLLVGEVQGLMSAGAQRAAKGHDGDVRRRCTAEP